MQYTVINPFTQKEIHQYNLTTKDESFKALEELDSFKSKRTPYERFEILLKLKELVLKNKNELAKLISLETGKVIKESLIEVDRALVTLEVSAEEAKRINGESIAANSFGAQTDKIALVMRKPIGLVMCITPFNFPLNLAFHKIGPAFASGNKILFKPHEQCPQLSELIMKLCLEAGFDQNEIKMIIPEISTLNEIISDSRIHCISFTGGTKTADKIASLCGRKKLLLELGGNDPLIVFEDADLIKAVDVAIAGRFGTAGQRCTANKRLFIHEDVYTRFKTLLIEKSKKLTIGDPLSESSDIGPLFTKCSANNVKRIIDDAASQGAKILLGGNQDQAIIHPTILENVPHDCELISDETFGPVIPLIKFHSLEDVIKEVNSTPYGLQAGVFTQSISRAKDLFNQLEVGSVIINDGPGFRQEHLPFGGVKSSGQGREGIKYAIEELSTVHSLIL